MLIRIVFSVIPEYGLLPAPFILFGAYLVLSASQPAISARFPVLTQPSLLLQALVVAALVLIPPPLDYYALLFVPLGLIAAKYLPYGRDLVWVGILCVLVTATLLVAHGLAQGLSYCITYVAGILLLSLYGRTARKAEEARKRSEELLVQLRTANRKLSQYAEQAEEVATVHERNRLARELHDAATQTVFSLTLTAETARLACEQDPGRLPALLERIQESGADALAEMRALVSELRLRYVAEDGLVPTLRQHFATRERRERLRIAFAVEGEERGEVEAKEALFRTAQEALNNTVKHAGVELAEVYLAFGDREAASGREALELIGRKKPEIVLMDLVMPEMDGIEATQRVRAEHPDVRVIVLTSFAEEDKVFPAIRAGAMAYLLKDVTPAELANKEIASELFISEKTVKTHISNILGKLNLADRTQAAVYAVKHGCE